MPANVMTFSDCREQDVLTVVMLDGETVDGSYLTQAGMHFLSIRNPDSMLLKKVIGPFTDDAVRSVSLIRSRDEIMEARYDKLRGERHPGREPVTREDYEYRLETLAKAVATGEGNRRNQLIRQFDDVADRIALARAKRQWMLSAGRWALKSNSPPCLADLWMADVASPSFIARPRPQDFDPDPAERRRRVPQPEEALADPRSVPNVLRDMKTAGLKAVVSLAGDPAWERAVIQIDLGPGRTMRHLAEARRGKGGQIVWHLNWGGNHSAPGLRKKRQSMKLDTYQELKRIVTRANRAESQEEVSECR
ncbi:hypothetical protein G6L37_00280 [Agrobacterium rubi]|nr:hypothetical protein [Agrobacterium rubi]NTF23825.1 hypothetical protein [Agrobacterium rubi]